MTKKDFLNALVNPAHAEVKIKLRTLRKELKEINWKLKYRYYKKTKTFYMMCWPTAVSKGSQTIVSRLLVPLHKIKNSHIDVSYNERNGEVYADVYITQ